MDDQQLEQLLEKYKKGLCTEEELRTIESLAAQDEDDLRNLPQREHPLREQLWKRLERRPALVYIRRLTAIAASILLFAFGLFLYFPPSKGPQTPTLKYTTVSTGKGEVRRIVLTDGSVIWLNAGSSLKYSSSFNRHTREVYLEGEAFFKVAHNARKPFTVHSSQLNTTVLGTSFNIRAYRQQTEEVVSVRTGKVRVFAPEAKQLAILRPGKQLSYHKRNQRTYLTQFNGDDLFAWTRNELVLNDATFKELAFALEHRYNVVVIPPRRNVSSYRYNIHLRSGLTLKNALEILQSIDGLTYSIKGDTLWVR